jgi:hypothetical protein
MSILFSHPIKKLTLLSVFAGGYVLGAKAGRERYEQILQAAGQVKADPRVQQAAARAEDLARDAATKVTEEPHVKKAADKVKDTVGTSTSGSDSTTPTPTPTDTQAGGVNPLLADEHVATEDEVVYSTGPDIEETVDELIPTNDDERL